MAAVARVTVLDLRTIAPNWRQVVLVPVLVMAVFYNRPEMILPALALLYATAMAGYPFQISDRSDLDTLYAFLPLTRRTLLCGRYEYPVFIRFGHSRAGTAATTLPIVAVAFVALRAHLDLKLSGMGLALLAVGGVVLLCASMAVAITIDPRRARLPIAG